MTTLPPFIELMASLGLDSKPTTPSRSPSPSNSPRPRITNPASPTRSKSSPALRDLSISHRGRARYSPYSSISYTRRGSISSISSCSSEDKSPSARHLSHSSLQSRRSGAKLSVNIYGSSTDLSANMPISTYVRRKTPGASPTSPTFPRDYREDSLSPPSVIFTVPSLPTLLPSSIGGDSVPVTPASAELSHMDTEYTHSSKTESQPLLYTNVFRHPTGIRISTPPRAIECVESHISHHPLTT
ncbi:hypothetical protein BDQ17DRAFT_1422073 [Cyathus striatus]|nr:hypothetical protein BDQ17DRAFT_1422073 [Cyathus striatus]